MALVVVPQIDASLLVPRASTAGFVVPRPNNRAGSWIRPPPPTTASTHPAASAASSSNAKVPVPALAGRSSQAKTSFTSRSP